MTVRGVRWKWLHTTIPTESHREASGTMNEESRTKSCSVVSDRALWGGWNGQGIGKGLKKRCHLLGTKWRIGQSKLFKSINFILCIYL